ncbi:aminotransferase class I/II-fold pyridoxal phosphate-dependent enzyme [Pseudoalteromonas sp. MMG005]|uniref:trans-sulfuration enzyme family protein n=1 Tax=Pseudoalteromonas sp. MMG005 TaxID=2822682 RepID=UPI001B39E706|nr:aminotransferase class I/II-fold pyridoxal phosphate-dependent enzyme [Pseudoalteromonas sp. MMG005]MBQ4846688.1 aminotransferase class I/II-fold pyridoxal phosphate-dependent enzyme [Pseudoalteromonas sp. MMG005]
MTNHFKPSTLLINDNIEKSDQFGAVVPPIYQNSLFTFDSWDAIELAFEDKINNAIYTRGNNPTVSTVEKKIAQLANGEKAKLFASGMAAVSAGLLHFLSYNDHIITLNNIYGPSISFINDFLIPKMNIRVTFVSGKDNDEIEKAIQPNTKLIYLESPSSVVFSLQDIRKVTQLARTNNIATIIDNTWCTPIYQKPLTMGVDLELHSCSKYLGGHSDIVSGVLIGSNKLISAICAREYELLGAKMAPVEAWYLLRSLRTLHLRMERHQSTAKKIAEFLYSHKKIKHVNYPGLDNFEQKFLVESQMSGVSGLMSFQLKTNHLPSIKSFFNHLELFQIGVSWGGHESLIYAPAISCIKEQPPEQFEKMGISLGDMRISVGLESSDDLITDLEQALSYIK